MTLRKTILASIALTAVGLIAILYATFRNNLIEGHTRLETDILLQHVERVHRGMAARVDFLETRARDFAARDEVRRYLVDPSSFEGNPLDGRPSDNVGLRIIALLDTTGRPVATRTLDGDTTRDDPLMQSLPELLRQEFQQNGYGESFAGIVDIESDTLLVAIEPVRGMSDQPDVGSLVIATDFIDTVVPELADVMGLDIQIGDLDGIGDARARTADNDGQQGFMDRQGVVVDAHDSDRITALLPLRDMFDEPSLSLRISSPRTIYKAGQVSSRYSLQAMIIFGVALIALIFLWVDRLVLLPLARLDRQVIRFGKTGKFDRGAHQGTHGKLGELERNIGRIFSQLRSARDELRRRNNQLESSVAERTTELVDARDTAVTALRTRDHILANIAHDTRTPLNTIVLRSEIMKTGKYGPVTPEQQHALDSIITSVNQLNLFMTNLLYEAGSDNAGLGGARESADLAGEVNRIVTMLSPLAERKTLQLTTSMADDVPAEVFIERRAFHQIVSNLVDNAIKFTKRGKVSLHIEHPEPGHLRVRVSDTGRGIPREIRDFIFEPFWQADGSVTRDTNRGIGLGLAIVRRLVGGLGGNIDIRDRAEGGTEITVTLPIGMEQDMGATK